MAVTGSYGGVSHSSSPASAVTRPIRSPRSESHGVTSHLSAFRRISSAQLLTETRVALSGALNQKRPSLCGGFELVGVAVKTQAQKCLC